AGKPDLRSIKSPSVRPGWPPRSSPPRPSRSPRRCRTPASRAPPSSSPSPPRRRSGPPSPNAPSPELDSTLPIETFKTPQERKPSDTATLGESQSLPPVNRRNRRGATGKRPPISVCSYPRRGQAKARLRLLGELGAAPQRLGQVGDRVEVLSQLLPHEAAVE